MALDQLRYTLAMIRATTVRVLRALHTTLGRWLADQPAAPKRKRTSWFDVEPGRFSLPRDPDEEEAEAFARAHNLPRR
jgi:hypothetical protein